MSTTWVLKTKRDPLAAIRKFLTGLQEQARLGGYVVPQYQEDGRSIYPALIENPADLADADPFAPMVRINAAKIVAGVDQSQPGLRYGAVLRSCEIRALKVFAQKALVNPDRWLVIGVDCLSSFPSDDLEWRVQKAGSIQELTHNALRFARQGGIAPYRFRRGCQMCVSPEPPESDLYIHVLGLPVNDYLLIQARNGLSKELKLEALTDGPASPYQVSSSNRLRNSIKKRRISVRLQAVDNLLVELPYDAVSLLELLASCGTCRKCLEACPIYAGELDSLGILEDGLAPEVERWLASCLSCGMCEEACPNHLPLTAIKSRISRQLSIA